MVDINNIVSRGGYLVDGSTGEKVLFYECDPRKNTECNREMCRGDGAEDEGGFGFCSKTLDPRFRKDGGKVCCAEDIRGRRRALLGQRIRGGGLK